MTNRLSIAIFLLLLTASSLAAAAQTDTLSLTLPDAEQRLLKNNLPLLMQQYNIDAAKAQVITARLWDNPQIDYENVLYNRTNGKWLDAGYNGQNAVSVQQLFKLAGQRNKAIRLAQSGVRMTEYQFFDMMRTLRFELRDNFYDLCYKERSLATYGSQVAFLQRIVAVFEEQQAKGNISRKEVIRLKSLLYDLQREQLDLQKDIQQTQSDLALLIRVPATIWIQPQLPDTALQPPPITQYSFQNLLDTARANRADLKVAQENVNYNNLNLRLQKALAIPDVQLGVSYDKQGSFERDYTGVGISLPIPLFNRNQGNIRMARATLESSRLQLQGQQDQVEHDVMNSYQQALKTEKLLEEFDPGFGNDYTKLMEEIQKNYLLHNIGLLEFIDLYDDYRNNVLKMNELRYNRLNALESLNFATGASIFHP